MIPGQTWISPGSGKAAKNGGTRASPLGRSRVACQSLERRAKGGNPSREPDPFGDLYRPDQHAGGTQILKHGADNRFAAIRAPRSVRADPQAVAPVYDPERRIPR